MDAVLEKADELLGCVERFLLPEDQREFNRLILRIRRLWLKLNDEEKLTRGVQIRETLDLMRQDMEKLHS